MEWQFLKAKIVTNEPVNPEIWKIKLHCPEVASRCKPGNFVMLRAWDGDAYLPRPMAVFCHDQRTLEVCYRIKGIGTQILANVDSECEVTITGPLGKAIEHELTHKTVALIGRGVGITPLYMVGQAAFSSGGKVLSFLSARERKLLFGEEEFTKLGDVYTQTDDHEAVMITEKLAELLKAGQKLDYAYISGSKRLLEHCEMLAKEYGFTAFVFLESRMACGIGYCKGCVVERKEGQKKYALCCKEGPLFPAKDVVLV